MTREMRMANGETADDLDGDVLLQLRRLRLRRNGYVGARALLLVGALALGVTAVVLPAALRLDALALTALMAALAVTAAVVLAVVGRDLRRDALTIAGAATWADHHARLDGRLATLCAVHGSRAARSTLYPVLVEQVRARADEWSAARLVPNLVPPAPLAALLGAAGALVVALLLTPDMLPSAPAEHAQADAPPPPVETATPTRPPPARAVEHDAGSAVGGTVRWVASMQDRLRETAWGDDWQRVRAALARAEAARREREAAHEAANGTSVLPFARTAAADRHGPRPESPAGAGARGDGTPGAAEPSTPKEAGRAGMPSQPAQTGSGGGSGAGSEPNQQLFAESPATTQPAGDAFTLAIAARVRARGGLPRPPRGEAPPSEPDARPQLARRQRPPTPFHRMPVPPEYASLLRRLYERPAPSPPSGRETP